MKDGFIRQANERLISVEKIVTVLYMEYSNDFVFAGEKHDFWEFTYIDKGSVKFTADTREFLLKDGEIAFHKPNEFHKLEAYKKPPNVTIASFVCNSAAMKLLENKIFCLTSKERTLLSQLLDEGLAAFEPLTPHPPIMGMREKQNSPFASKQLTFNLLETFLITLLRRSEFAISREKRSVSKIEKSDYPKEIYNILLFMEQEVISQLTVRDIADKFNLSESKLKRLFFENLGCGVIAKFNDLKLRHAKILIREKNLNFTEISEALGFSSVHYFSRLFKKKTGMTPTEYASSVL